MVHRIWTARGPVLSALIFIFAGRPGLAEITYVSNGEMPDLPQIWEGQTMRAICEAAASSDVLWYFDQHGYRGLVAHQDPERPNATWRADGKNLVHLTAKYIYGRDPANGAASNLGQGSTYAALGRYIKVQRMYAGQRDDGLVVDLYQAGTATYANWARTISDSSVNIGALSWKRGQDVIAKHSMASAGVDSDRGRLVVTHGWGDHPGDQPPYKRPPYAAGEEPYINEYPMQVASDRATIPNPGDGSVELFRGDTYGRAERMEMFEFFNIHPRARARVDMRRRGPGAALDATYDVEVTNDSFEPIFQYIQQVETPIDDVVSPPGWEAIPWTSTASPDITRPPFQSAPPPYENDPVDPPILGAQHGILWYTVTDPIFPGDTAYGFAISTSEDFTDQLEDSMAFLTSPLSTAVDPASTDHTTELVFPTLQCGG